MTELVTIGFGDAEAALHGVARPDAGAALLDGAELRSDPGVPTVDRVASGWRVVAGDLFTAELQPLGEPVSFGDDSRVWHCHVTGTAAGRSLDCVGQCAVGSPQTERHGLVRSVGAWFGPDLGFTCRSTRPSGAADHERESLEVFVLRGDPLVAVPILDPRLSTTYDDAGRHYRSGLELWENDDSPFPLRLAGESLGHAELKVGDRWLLRSAFFAWRHDGLVGAGRYDIELPR